MKNNQDTTEQKQKFFVLNKHTCFKCVTCDKTPDVARSDDFKARGKDAVGTLKCNKCLRKEGPQLERNKSGNQLYECFNCGKKKLKAQFKKDDFERPQKVCRACKTSSRQPTGAAASPAKSKNKEADGPGERLTEEKSITVSVSVIESVRL